LEVIDGEFQAISFDMKGIFDGGAKFFLAGEECLFSKDFLKRGVVPFGGF
jgi:hypothetical protein